MPDLTVKGMRIDDTFAEAFGMRATAIVITADNARWARQAALVMTGFATSVIGCGCEASIDRELTRRQTPDGRPGVRVLLFAVSTAELQKQLQTRVAQCVLTSPGSACYAGYRRRGYAPSRQCASLFWRRLADLQAFRRPAFLAHPGDGRRVRVRSRYRADQERCGRGQPSHYGTHDRKRRAWPPSAPPPRLPKCRT